MELHSSRALAADMLGAAASRNEGDIDREDRDVLLVRLAQWPGGIGEEPLFGEAA